MKLFFLSEERQLTPDDRRPMIIDTVLIIYLYQKARQLFREDLQISPHCQVVTVSGNFIATFYAIKTYKTDKCKNLADRIFVVEQNGGSEKIFTLFKI